MLFPNTSRKIPTFYNYINLYICFLICYLLDYHTTFNTFVYRLGWFLYINIWNNFTCHFSLLTMHYDLFFSLFTFICLTHILWWSNFISFLTVYNFNCMIYLLFPNSACSCLLLNTICSRYFQIPRSMLVTKPNTLSLIARPVVWSVMYAVFKSSCSERSYVGFNDWWCFLNLSV